MMIVKLWGMTFYLLPDVCGCWQDSYYMARTTSLCGMAPRGTLPVASDFTHCFYKTGTLVGWEACMEATVRGDSFLGGGEV